MRSFLILLAFLIVIPAFGQRKKEEVETIPTYNEGLTYALPRTGIRVQIIAEEEVFTPGPFANYANDLLGIPNVPTQATSSWAMEGIHFSCFTEPDPEKVYKTQGRVASLLTLSGDGCLAGVNLSNLKNENKTEKPTQGDMANQLLNQQIKSSMVPFVNFSQTSFYTVGDSTNNFRPAKIPMQQKAAEAAAKILACRSARFDIAAGLLDEFHPDGEAYKQSLEQLKAIELEYLSLFVGKTTNHQASYSFELVPAKNTSKGQVVFRFSEQKGVLDKSDLSGKPVMLDVVKVDALSAAYNGKATSQNPSAGTSGVNYNIPGIAEITLSYELSPIATGRVPFAQFGVVASVPEELLDGAHQLEYYPETGSIKSIFQK